MFSQACSRQQQLVFGIILFVSPVLILLNIRQRPPPFLEKANAVVKRPDNIQQSARLMLKKMEERGAMNTPVSSRNATLVQNYHRVFPRVFEPCLLQRLFQNKDKIKITVTGGSTAARPGLRCTNNGTTNPHGGRYSNLLEKGLREDSNSQLQQWEVVNMGQGGEVTTRGALFLDGYFDVKNTDLIIWDYFINDDAITHNGKGGRPEQVRMLDFWLTRVYAHFQPASPPPIVLLYLWEFKAAQKLKENQIQTLDQKPMNYLGDLIDSYRALGWDIAVVNVPAAVNITQLKKNVRVLFDDSHHPSCQGTHLIADLLEHALLSNLAPGCPLQELPNATNNQTKVSLPHHTHRIPAGENPQLWKDLFNPQARVGSFSAFEPRLLPDHSNLHISNNTHFGKNYYSSWPKVLSGKADPSREDRKYGYHIPACKGSNITMDLALQEPDLKWLGLALEGSASFEVTLNGRLVAPTPATERWGGPPISHWIRIQQPAKEHVLTICHKNKKPPPQRSTSEPNLQYLVTVSLPRANSTRT